MTKGCTSTGLSVIGDATMTSQIDKHHGWKKDSVARCSLLNGYTDTRFEK